MHPHHNSPITSPPYVVLRYLGPSDAKNKNNPAQMRREGQRNDDAMNILNLVILADLMEGSSGRREQGSDQQQDRREVRRAFMQIQIQTGEEDAGTIPIEEYRRYSALHGGPPSCTAHVLVSTFSEAEDSPRRQGQTETMLWEHRDIVRGCDRLPEPILTGQTETIQYPVPLHQHD